MTRLLIAALLATPLLSAQVVTVDNCVHQSALTPGYLQERLAEREMASVTGGNS